MPYVQLDAEGRICALSAEQSEVVSEWIESDAPKLRAYLESMQPGAPSALVESDQALIRVLEDLVEPLIAKDMMRFTDLPEAAQQKLLQRRSLRASINSLNLLDDDEQKLI